jgi:hypothetical protein
MELKKPGGKYPVRLSKSLYNRVFYTPPNYGRGGGGGGGGKCKFMCT